MTHSSLTQLLVVDDDPHVLAFLADFLSSVGFQVHLSTSGPESMRLLREHSIELVLLDENLPTVQGHELIAPFREIKPGLPVIIMTGQNSVRNAVETIQQGANDYITKPLNLEDLLPRIERALESSAIPPAAKTAHAAPTAYPAFPAPLAPPPNLFPNGYYEGTSPVRTRIRDEIKEVASIPELTVLIVGETGIGKDIAAKRIHSKSANCDQPFVVVNCTSVSDEVWEAELFGIESGPQTRAGLLETVGTGTLFFDEITSLSSVLQSRLLHLLDGKTFHRLGSRKALPMRARCIFSTNRPLLPLIHRGVFRQDFYYRISMFTLNLPPLRDTMEDILPLTGHFLNHFNQQYRKAVTHIPVTVQQGLVRHQYPGNILELRHLIERSVIGATGSVLPADPILDLVSSSQPQLSLLPSSSGFQPPASSTRTNAAPVPIESPQSLEHVETEAVRNALQSCKGNKSKAAKVLGISRRALYRRLDKFQDEPPSPGQRNNVG